MPTDITPQDGSAPAPNDGGVGGPPFNVMTMQNLQATMMQQNNPQGLLLTNGAMQNPQAINNLNTMNNNGMLMNLNQVNTNAGMLNNNNNNQYSQFDMMSAVQNALGQQQQQQQQQALLNPLLLQAMLNPAPAAQPVGVNLNLNAGNQQMPNADATNNHVVNNNNNNVSTMANMNNNIGMANTSNNNNVSMATINTNSNTSTNLATSNNKSNVAPVVSSPTDNNTIILQLMSNPLALQMIAAGFNPALLLGVLSNPLLTSPGLINNTTNVAAPHPNALFAFNNSNPIVSQAAAQASPIVPGIPSFQPQAVIMTKSSGKKGKKAKDKDKPKRPLSAYNFFFREERERILNEKIRKEKEEKSGKKEEGDGDDKDGDADEDDGIKVYNRVGSDGKKIPHGKIGFESLAKQIGKAWRELDAEEREKYTKLANDDTQRYKKEMRAFQLESLVPAADGSMPSKIKMPSIDPAFYSSSLKRKGGSDAKKSAKRSKAEKKGGD